MAYHRQSNWFQMHWHINLPLPRLQPSHPPLQRMLLQVEPIIPLPTASFELNRSQILPKHLSIKCHKKIGMILQRAKTFGRQWAIHAVTMMNSCLMVWMKMLIWEKRISISLTMDLVENTMGKKLWLRTLRTRKIHLPLWQKKNLNIWRMWKWRKSHPLTIRFQNHN